LQFQDLSQSPASAQSFIGGLSHSNVFSQSIQVIEDLSNTACRIVYVSSAEVLGGSFLRTKHKAQNATVSPSPMGMGMARQRLAQLCNSNIKGDAKQGGGG